MNFDRTATNCKLALVPRTPDEIEQEAEEARLLREHNAMLISLDDARQARLQREERARRNAQQALDRPRKTDWARVPGRLIASIVEMLRGGK